MTTTNPPAASQGRTRAIAPGPGMVTRSLVVEARDVLAVKAILDGYDGLAAVFAERGGDLIVAAPLDRAADLDEALVSIVGWLRGRAT